MENFVIKVQYGETLRRFNSRVADGKLDLNMNALREKVLSLFSFPANSDLAFTYIDEDGDVVTLADEDDLNDIMRQFLNPLRITVKLNTKRSARSHSGSSGNLTPVRSPGVQPPLQDGRTSIHKVLNSLPKETILRLSTKLGLDTNSPQGYVDLIDSLAKMGLTYLKEVSVSSAKGGPFESSTAAAVTKDKNSSIAVGTTQVSEMKISDMEQGNNAGHSGDFVMTATEMEHVKDRPSTLLANTTDSSNVTGGCKQDEDNKFCGYPRGNCNISSSKGNKVGNNGPSGHKMEAKKSIESVTEWMSDMGPKPLIGIDSSFSGLPSSVNRRQLPHCVVPFKRSYSHRDGIGGIIHRGVQCDGCGIHPIIGSRFKSVIKDDYDLCSVCFADMGSEVEYIRINHPTSYQNPGHLSFPMQHCLGHSSTLPDDHYKLDSCFIQDVNILDGTIMTPSTQFTKIWRMRNNGAVVWPPGTNFQWNGGIKFSKTLFCDLKIPAEGCPVDKEIDIAVDFIAPEHPGRYVSFWRMATPSGHKFGDRVWIIIQVDSSLKKDTLTKNIHGFNLNLPPVSGGCIMDFQNENACGDPITGDGHIEIVKFNKAIVEPVVNTPERGDGLNLPINDTPLVTEAKPNSGSLEASLRVTYPNVDLSKTESIAISVPRYSDIDGPSSMVGMGQGKDEVEQTLEDMGFNQADLNKKILRKNDYDLEQTINELCGVTEWDPILVELQEMGFSNNDMNRMLLEKNKGSIKRVVMDLIAGEDA